MILVGLTGGLGAGKSTVAALLAERGAIVVDADVLAREALDPGTPGFDRAVEAFGTSIVGEDGAIDREALAAIVFADPGARATLESITHPEVFRLLAEETTRRRETDAVVVFDAALLVESGFAGACDLVVTVESAAEERVRRAVARGMSEEEARARIEAQATAAEREAAADVVMRNDGSPEDLAARVEDLWAELEARAAGTG